ncbi:MAG: substrate-binding domain-containing protein [Chromatiaceae bacterium]|nr:substrate-binding domain-containing protein [Chromatiaceae bacterium]
MRRHAHRLLTLFLFLSLAAGAVDLSQRQHILIVGSSTAYPIIAAAAERIGREHGLPTPVVESTGSGGGFKLFCAGLGLQTPDIVMASRRMKHSERVSCTNQHVDDVREIKIGYDGIVIANSKDAPHFSLTRHDLLLALAREVPAPEAPDRLIANPYTSWQQVNPALPDLPIRVLGPPPTSGTRDILVERLLHSACLAIPALEAAHENDPAAFAQHCQGLREDGAFVNAGENDARLVRKLIDDRGALGIFGYNFLDRNRDRLQAASIDGISPEFDLIESGVYPLSRPLYLYVKQRHRSVVKGLDEFVDTLISAEVSGPEGYLIDQGLIPLTEAETHDTGR